MKTKSIKKVSEVKASPNGCEFSISWAHLKAISLFSSKDETRYVLKGINIEIDGIDSAILVATDGRILGAIKSPLASAVLNGKLTTIIPSQLLASVKVHRKVGEVFVKIEPHHGHFLISITDPIIGITSQMKSIEGNYPNWRQVVPHGIMRQDLRVSVNPKLLDSFNKARMILDGEREGMQFLSCAKTVEESEKLPYFIDFGIRNFLGVIMPIRNTAPNYEIPKWSFETKSPEPKEKDE